MKASWWFIYNQ